MKSQSPGRYSPSSQQKLKIIIRMRPILEDEDSDQFVQLEDDNTLYIKKPSNHTYMKFNNILPPDSTQKDVFMLVQDSIKEFLNGRNVTIFAYGQTGAGKTYTIIGNYSQKDSHENLFNFLSSRQRGILSRSLQMVLGFLKKNTGYKILVSFFQIYNQKIFDLYNSTMTPLEVRESKSGEVTIPQLLDIEVQTMQQVLEFLMVGLKNRSTGSTYENAQSSRSHSIFQIKLQKISSDGEVKLCTLRIVDLAGSEKFKIPSNLSHAEKQLRIHELTSINSSLSCLGHCISSLIEKQRTHIPFRNSKLTRILSDSLLGNGILRFVICISPSLSSSAQTFSTLQFANRAKKAIFERFEPRTPTPNRKNDHKLEIKKLRQQLEIQRKIRINLQKQLTYKQTEQSSSLIHENTDLRKENEKLKQQLKILHNGSCTLRGLNPSNIFLQNTVDQGHQQTKVILQTASKRQELKKQLLNLPIFRNNYAVDLLERKINSKSISENDLNNERSVNAKPIQKMIQNTSKYEQKKPKARKSQRQSRAETQISHNISLGTEYQNRKFTLSNKENRLL